jgi:glycosyltransferase involved in cell wall biosynthesis
MKMLISSYTLDLSGVPTYTLTLYEELKKRGHKVEVYSPLGGSLSSKMNAQANLVGVTRPDVIIAQHNICTESMRIAFPNVPMVFFAHHPDYEGEQPPSFECAWYTAINENTVKNLVLKGVPANKITIIRDFIDTDRFCSTSPINNNLKDVLYVSNRKKWRTYENIKKACEMLGVNFKAVGAPYGRARSIENDFNKADLVIGWARCLMEAMACGRPVISYDKEFGDGYLDYETYLRSRTRNFGPGCDYKYTVEGLVGEIKKYNPKDGEVNREIILQEHNVVRGVDQILFIVRRIV